LNGIAGNHCVVAVIGDQAAGLRDKIFVDGVEVKYLTQGIASTTLVAAQQTNSISFVGYPGIQVFAHSMITYSTWASATRDTPAQVMARSAFEKDRLTETGVLFGLPTSSSTVSSCAISGTSIDEGYQAHAMVSSLLI
jgi:hypothetical protein